MAKTFRPYEPDQILLLPPSLREWLPADHLVYFVSDVTAALDLSAIHADYPEERGYPPYHPLLMTRVLLYGYARGVYSSRKLARACEEDVAFRILCAGNQPDHRTINEFRRRHLDVLAGLFVQVLLLCREAGLAKLGHVAIDGTKVKANASKHKAMSYARMQEEEARLEAEVRRLLVESEAADRADDERYGAERRGDELPEALRHPESRLEGIREAKAALEAEAAAAAAEAEAEAGRPGGRRRRQRGSPDGVPGPKAQRNFTDPESRIMLGSDKAFVQGYNAQAAVDHESQVIVGIDVVQAANDKGQLVPMVEQFCETLEEVPGAVSADTGYWSAEDIETLEYYQIPAFVATGKIRHREWREQAVLPEPVPPELGTRERMAYRLRTGSGRAEYDKRKTSVEPVFGQIKGARGFRQFLLRSHEKVKAEWALVCTAHNLLKLKNSGWRPPKGGGGAAACPRMALAGG